MTVFSLRPQGRALLMVAAVAAGVAIPVLRPAEAVPSYDGLWSVVILTKMGVCDSSYRYPIRINNGHVTNGGNATVRVSGKVGKDGKLVVNVSAGQNTATGTGRLAGNRGSGSWTGGNGACSGDWTAERRG
ncbi:MAG: hypothetical protein ACJ8F3_22230 [Xanthobacteraceae bacterium]